MTIGEYCKSKKITLEQYRKYSMDFLQNDGCIEKFGQCHECETLGEYIDIALSPYKPDMWEPHHKGDEYLE